MFLLRTLGAVGLYREAAGELVAIAVQPKRLALLVFLARAEPGVSLRRDTLVALFWPESDLEHARGALRQALHGLRQVLGDGVLLTRGEDEVSIAPAAVRCDAREFERASAEGDLASALGAYRGDFLDGFHIGEATSEFEQWVDAERTSLRHLAARAIRMAAEAAERSGDMHEAEEWARRATVLTPDDETALARVIALLDRQGNRAGALAVYEAFRRRLREAYEAEPSPETRALVEAIRAREAAAVSSAAPAGADAAPRVAADDGPPPQVSTVQKRPQRKLLIGVAAGATITLALAATLAKPAPGVAPLDPGLVAVAPFRLAAADTNLAYLRQGVANLLAGALTGEGGPRALDSRLLLAAWDLASSDGPTRAKALRLTAGLGAARMVQGSVVAVEGQVELRASLLSVPGGEVRAEAVARGPLDSLSSVVERLAAGLLVGDAKVLDQQLAATVPLAALRAYLNGSAALRRGDWSAAVECFDRALTIDSTFASAALALRSASSWTDGMHAQRAESIAWRFRHRLGQRERVLFLTELGPNYPAWFPHAARLRAWLALLAADWANGGGWRHLGTEYYYHGARLDVPAPVAEARIALERALELDSLGGEALRVHLIDIAAVTGNRALLGRVVAHSQGDSSVAARAWHRWLRAFTARDSAALAHARTGLALMDPHDLKKVWSMTQRAGHDVQDAMAATLLLARTKSDEDRAWAALMHYNLALNRGRPAEAQTVAGGLTPEWRPLSRLSLQVLTALYGDGASAAGLAAARALAPEVARPLASDPAERRSQVIHVCVGEQWRLAHGDTRSVNRAIAKLRTPEPAAPGWAGAFYESCAAIIEAWRAIVERRRDAPLLVERMDSLMRSGTPWHWSLPEHRVVARIWESAGDPARAVTAVRRRRFDAVGFLAADLREEGRLAALTGDTAGAIRAYRHYLVLRFDPEPVLRAQRDSVRQALAHLESARL